MNAILRRAALIGAICLPMSLSAGAESAAENSASSHPKALDNLLEMRDLTLVKAFDTDAPALKGYVLKDKTGKYGIAYTVQDVLVFGKIMDADGLVLSDKYAEQNIPKPDYAAAIKAIEKDKTLVVEGKKGAPELFVFADPNCIFCHKFFEQTRDWVAQGKVQINWIMVGFLKPSSQARAAAIIAAKDRAKANALDHEQFDEAKEEGSIAPLEKISPEMQATLQKHEELMYSVQFQGTPGLIFKDKNSQWQGVSGMPPAEQLAAALGISG